MEIRSATARSSSLRHSVVVVAVQVEQLGELVGDRARSLGEGEVHEVVGERTSDPDQVDAVVLVEAFVLGRHERFAEKQGDA